MASGVKAQACVACRKRKAKCIGNPCLYCVGKDITCEFKAGKKRGPAKKLKFPSKVEECGYQSLPLICNVLQPITGAATYAKHNFIDFYFKYIGRAIPKEFKAPLLTPAEKLTNERICQLYIISAHVMKLVGNKELEADCIAKAHKHSSNMFGCDTIDSAVCYTMMGKYLGDNHPKTYSYFSMAYNITMLPSVCNSMADLKLRYACKALCIGLDSSLSKQQKYAGLDDLMSTCAPEFAAYLSPAEWLHAGLVRMKCRLSRLGVIEDSSISDFIYSISNCSVKCQDYADLKHDLDHLHKILVEVSKEQDPDISLAGYATFMLHLLQFIIEWRSGNSQAAFTAALHAMSFYKEYSRILGLWCHADMLSLMSLPYFFRECGALEQAQNALKYFGDSVLQLGQQGYVNHMWEELCISTSKTYNITQIETELLTFDPNTTCSDVISNTLASHSNELLSSELVGQCYELLFSL